MDNFGDIGVCWRLARELAVAHGVQPRLWVDDLPSARRLIPSLEPVLAIQHRAGVEIRAWTDPLPAIVPGDVVIGAFACSLPAGFLEAMALRLPRPLWINLEYLSAEDWVAGCHRLPSPHPRLPLTQYFYFPGFDASSGGLLRERDYDVRWAAHAPVQCLTGLGLPAARPGELRISLFAYENAALPELLEVWRNGTRPLTCLVPEGRVLPQVAQCLGRNGLKPGDRIEAGALRVVVIPFVEQSRYDELLWACDLNFVRGEDSFVRAQWAECPFVWQIYRQDDDAHLDKLDAFLARYAERLPPSAGAAVRDFWRAWNRGHDAARAWQAFADALPALSAAAPAWSAHLQQAGELAAGLVQFSKDQLK